MEIEVDVVLSIDGTPEQIDAFIMAAKMQDLWRYVDLLTTRYYAPGKDYLRCVMLHENPQDVIVEVEVWKQLVPIAQNMGLRTTFDVTSRRSW